MIDHKTAPYGAALLRITAGLAFLAHAALKLFVFTPSGTVHYFASLGLPGWFGLFVIAAEILAGVSADFGLLRAGSRHPDPAGSDRSNSARAPP